MMAYSTNNIIIRLNSPQFAQECGNVCGSMSPRVYNMHAWIHKIYHELKGI